MFDPYSEDTQGMQQSQSTTLPRHQKKERRTNNHENKRHIWSPRRTDKTELEQRNRLGTVSRETTLKPKPALLARNLITKACEVPDYKHMFGPHRSPLRQLWNILMNYLL